MYNWSTDTTALQQDPKKYTIWKLEQLINYGLDGEKLDKKLVVKYWDDLRLDPQKKKVLAFWLWHKQEKKYQIQLIR
ncbi:MAG: hypothetical protein AAB553_00860 [Patescibacteria group bacterium]